ncbi:MAG: SMP-30/gluconolactonase/LRE family protein [Silicimonas sp.]|nr:SMP-30/gluconolactonase/LRE family protein [Silicimonas sp.]
MEVECVVASRSQIGEGAVWDDEDQALWWVDIPPGLIHRFDPQTGENETWDFGEPVGCLALRARGGLVVAAKSGFYTFDPSSGHRQAIFDPEAHLPENRFNDGTTDPRGRFWAGTMKDGGDLAPQGTFYRLDPDMSVTTWRNGFYTTNGSAFSPDGSTMYFSDSNPARRTIWRAPYDLDTGRPGAPEVFLDTRDMPGRPDGGTVDADGCYWMAGVDGWQVYRITPEGKVDRTIDLPVERPSKPMFGGRERDTLYVTSLGIGLSGERPQPLAGSLFAITGLGVSGLPQTRFEG